MDHDESYKLLFSHPEMVADLIRGFVHEDWVKDLDFGTLERVSGSFVADDLRGRESDVIWKLKLGPETLYVYLLIEFQSSVDAFMAVRTLIYVALLYQDLIRKGTIASQDKLPPVLPIVLYNGNRRWDAAEEIADLIAPVPAGLDRYFPRFRYLLLDEGRYVESDLAPLRNLAAALFRMENSRTPEDVERVVSVLVAWLQAPEQSSLRRAFTTWLKRVFLPGRMPGIELNGINELQEVQSMLAERVIEWTKVWERQGMEKGMEKGMQEGLVKGLEQGLEQGLERGLEKGLEKGRKEGEAALLLRQLEIRFGPLDETNRKRIQAADADTLLHWAERIFSAASLDDLFSD